MSVPASFFHKRILQLIILLLIPMGLQAELVNCNGTWTNADCPDKIQESLPERNSNQELGSSSHESMKKRESLLGLVSESQALRAAYGVSVSTGSATDICLNPLSTLIDCENAVAKLREQILEKRDFAEDLAKKQKQDSSEVSNETQTTVVVVQPRTERFIVIGDNYKKRRFPVKSQPDHDRDKSQAKERPLKREEPQHTQPIEQRDEKVHKRSVSGAVQAVQ